MKRLAASILFIVFIIGISCFSWLDNTPYRESSFYPAQIQLLDSILQLNPRQLQADTVQCGWAKVNLLPPFTTPIAIDAARGGRHFEGIRDSIYVRAFVFKQGEEKVAFISADLLIVPPLVVKMMDSVMEESGFSSSNIFYSATHTHTSLNDWHPSLVGEIFAGKYDPRVPAHLAQCFKQAITEAEGACRPARFGYTEVAAPRLVFNRLVKEKGRVDSTLRVLKIQSDAGKTAALFTFSAHCTIFHENAMNLSADWAGTAMRTLETSGVCNMASFSAGGVGSHGPFEHSKNQEEELNYMAKGVSELIAPNFEDIKTDYTTRLNMLRVPLLLREPNFRVTDNIVVRPWLFRKLFGDEPVFLHFLKLGDVCFAGTPCDFSGELIYDINKQRDKNAPKINVTSFNGGYIGYVTDSRWYHLNAYETRTMGWFGPDNGPYLVEIIQKMGIN
ncbi:MAG: neutral/alkaline non-lysosomal ceramidase N-terminal domain-containing protein [Bacteroidetes bacterium]|nr:neutral/alkaline non-lysosomal ceramidase N-terminal domain-containing protein [Bacteroidota bacterium]